MPALTLLAPGVYVWLAPGGGLGRTNAGVVLDADGATIVDTLMVPSQSRAFAAAVADLGAPVRRVVLTSSHIEFVGGTEQFRLAAIHGSPATSAHLDQPPNIAAYQAFFPEYADEFTDLTTRPVSHEIQDAVMLTDAVEVIPTAGHTAGNLLVHVPGAAVLFAGGMCSFGTTPLAFQGDPVGWAGALDFVAELAAERALTVVPGHGPLGGAVAVRDLQAYLRACATGTIPSGPWDGWARRDLDAINIERAALLARGDHSLPPSMARALGLA